jgi:hypothetical protein
MPDMTAAIDPWCVADTFDGKELFGYVVRHHRLGGLSWVRTSPIVELDASAGIARTLSGTRYQLGRRVQVEDIPLLGDDEPWLAFDLLVRNDLGDPDIIPERSADAVSDEQWLMACKAAHWLKLPPPRRFSAEVAAWLQEHAKAYLELRRQRDMTQGSA